MLYLGFNSLTTLQLWILLSYRILYLYYSCGFTLNSQSQESSWILEHDLLTQEVVFLDNDKLLLIGFWGAAILDDDGQLVKSIKYPSHWIADCTTNIYDQGLINHVDLTFFHVIESMDIEGNIVSKQDLDPSLMNECLHYVKAYKADENTIIFRNILDNLSHELLIDEMKFTTITDVSISVLDNHYINLYADYIYVTPKPSFEEDYRWEALYESPNFWLSAPNQINYIFSEESNLESDDVLTITYNVNGSNRQEKQTIQRRYSESLIRDRSEIIGQIHGETKNNCQYSVFIFDEVIQIMFGDPSKPLSSVVLDHELRVDYRNFTERIKSFSIGDSDLIMSIGNKLYGFTNICDQDASNDDQTDNEQSGNQENMDDTEVITPQQFQERFTWITSDLIANNCSELKITEYDFGGYSFVYFSDGKLYFEDGRLYCQTTEFTDCVSVYPLTVDKIANEWRCGENTSEGSEEESELGNEDENVFENENTSNLTDVLQQYTWLSDIELSNVCLIEEYDLGPFAFLYVIEDDASTLYFEDGTFYCRNTSTRDCRVLYDLSDNQISNIWSCDSNSNNNDDSDSENGSPQITNDLFADYTWVSSIISADCSTGVIIEYMSGPFFFLLIETEESADLYFQDGTYYCKQTPTFDCIEAYDLNDIGSTFSCGSDLKEVEIRNLEFDEFSVLIFPNPTQSIMNISIPSNHTLINIHTTNGELLKSYKDVTEGLFSVDVNEFDDGIYLITLINGEDIVTKKLIKI